MKRIALVIALGLVLGMGSTASAHNRGPVLKSLPDADDFVKVIDNRYLPFHPGDRWVYKEGEETVRVKVLHRTKTIRGIEATVVRDVTREDGRVMEFTFDWYAQDEDGNVWYLGERTRFRTDGGGWSREGSFKVGRDGARAGIIMLDRPRIGANYYQEFYDGYAEDAAQVLGKGMKVTVPVGRFRNVLMTEDTSTLEPGVVELKFYAPGVGLVRAISLNPERGSELLVSTNRGNP